MNTIPSPQAGHAVQEEQSQSIVRLLIFGLGFLFAVFDVNPGHANVIAFFAGFLAVAGGFYAAIRLWPAPNVSRRVLSTVADAVAITVGLFLAGDTGAVFVGIYLFVIFSHGFRYGRIYLHLSQLLCIASFISVCILVPWWRTNLDTAVGWLIALIVIPFYVSQFLELMRDARLKTEQALKECLERDRR